MRIVVTEFMDADAVATLAPEFEVRYVPDLVDRPRELEQSIASTDALIVRNRTRVTRELIARAAQLRVVGRLGVGLDNIDVAACRERGIEVIPATGANALAVAEYVIGTAIVLLRGIADCTPQVARGQWPRVALSSGREIASRTLGVVGFGSIGRHVATLARAMGMQVVAFDPALDPDDAIWAAHAVAPLSLDALLSRSDVVTLHVPLAANTCHLIDAQALDRMKRDAVLINTARGGVVDEQALAAALREGKLGGAALDVFEHEPLAMGSALAECPRLVLTPHIAGVTAESNVRVSMMIAHKVAAALRSRPEQTT